MQRGECQRRVALVVRNAQQVLLELLPVLGSELELVGREVVLHTPPAPRRVVIERHVKTLDHQIAVHGRVENQGMQGRVPGRAVHGVELSSGVDEKTVHVVPVAAPQAQRDRDVGHVSEILPVRLEVDERNFFTFIFNFLQQTFDDFSFTVDNGEV